MNLAEQTRKLTEAFIGGQTEEVRVTIQQAFEATTAAGRNSGSG